MTTFLLIRHGDTDAIGRTLAGWLPGCHLNTRGRRQVEMLAERLEKIPIQAIYTSPLERAMETARAVAGRHELLPQSIEDLGEMRFGAWEGMDLRALEQDPQWKRFNSWRSGTPCPGGEWMIETQSRMVRRMERIREAHADGIVAVVSHADPLRALVAHYAGMPLDHMLRLEIGPASVTVVEAGDWGPRILCLNHTGELPL
jgi:probable phosphoglycerate mutase